MRYSILPSEACVWNGFSHAACGCNMHCTFEDVCPLSHHPQTSGLFKVCVQGIVGPESLVRYVATEYVKDLKMQRAVTLIILARDEHKTKQLKQELKNTEALFASAHGFDCVPRIFYRRFFCTENAFSKQEIKDWNEALSQDASFVGSDVHKMINEFIGGSYPASRLHFVYMSDEGISCENVNQILACNDPRAYDMIVHAIMKLMEFVIYVSAPQGMGHYDIHPGNLRLRMQNNMLKATLIDWGRGVEIKDPFLALLDYKVGTGASHIHAQYPIQNFLFGFAYSVFMWLYHRGQLRNDSEIDNNIKSVLRAFTENTPDAWDELNSLDIINDSQTWCEHSKYLLYQYSQYTKESVAEQMHIMLVTLRLTIQTAASLDYDTLKRSVFKELFKHADCYVALNDLQALANMLVYIIYECYHPRYKKKVDTMIPHLEGLIKCSNSLDDIKERFDTLVTLTGYYSVFAKPFYFKQS